MEEVGQMTVHGWKVMEVRLLQYLEVSQEVTQKSAH
jgi:hypothetical protein